jgi:citronellol/citronellal dehydrogenase
MGGPPSPALAGKTLFITGASRGIGLAIGVRAARDGANVAIAAKTTEPHKHLPGTIYTAAQEIEAAGGRALPLAVDIRDEAAVQRAVDETVRAFGGIDACVNNASAISLTGTVDTEMKRFDLMHQINARGTFLVSRACVPHLKRADNPHVLMISPPPDLAPRWFAPHTAYTMAKFGMSLCVLGMASEFASDGIAFNALWPRTTIATAAIRFVVGGEELMRRCRRPEIMADAAYTIVTKPSRSFTGRFLIDDTFLYDEGERDFDRYRVDASVPLAPDFFVPDDIPAPPGVVIGTRERSKVDDV